MNKRKRKSNTLLGIIACICIMVLAVGIAGALTQGFTNADPYGWLAKAKQVIETELNKPSDNNTTVQEQDDSNPSNELNIYGELLTDGEEIRGIGYRANVAPDFSKIDWTQDEMSNVEGFGELAQYRIYHQSADVVGLMYSLKEIEGNDFVFIIDAVRMPYNENEIFFNPNDFVVPDVDEQGNQWVYYLFFNLFTPIYSNVFSSETNWPSGQGFVGHYNDDGWIDMLSTFINIDDLGTNVFLSFKSSGVGDSYDNEVYSEIHIFEKDFLDDIFFKLGENDGIDVLGQGE